MVLIANFFVANAAVRFEAVIFFGIKRDSSMEDFKILDLRDSTQKSIDVSVEQVRKLRSQTGYGMMMCKRALQEANGDESLAITILERQRSWLV